MFSYTLFINIAGHFSKRRRDTVRVLNPKHQLEIASSGRNRCSGFSPYITSLGTAWPGALGCVITLNSLEADLQ